MRSVFSGGGCPVVTTETGRGDAGMIEPNVAPHGRGVTVVAVIGALDVTDGLTVGDDAVMAALASSQDRAVIDPCGGREIPQRVARIAVIHAVDVINRLRLRSDRAAALMALDAASWRSCKNAVHMTALAWHASVTVFEREARRKMIEIPDALRGSRGAEDLQQREGRHGERQPGNAWKAKPYGHRRILTFLKLSV